MKRTGHILAKDLRLLWWHGALAQLPLLAFGHLDRWRGEWTVGPVESLMQLMAPSAWAVLLAVQAAVLWGRGFSVAACLDTLLERQLWVLGMVTLPALGLAAVTKGLGQFLPILLAGAAAITVLGSTRLPMFPWLFQDQRPGMLAVALFGAGYGLVAAWQYFRRTTVVSRMALAGVALLALAAFRLVPAREMAEGFAGGESLPPIPNSLALLPPEAAGLAGLPGFGPEPMSRFLIPVELSREARSELQGNVPAVLTLTHGSGASARSVAGPQAGRQIPVIQAVLMHSAQGDHLMLMMPEPQARVFAQGKTDVEGALLVMRFSLSRPGIRTAIDPQTVEAGPNLLCRQSTVLLPPDRSALRVDCEARRGNPPRVRLRLFDEASGHQTLAVTGDATRGGAPIRIEWLSPLSRRTGFLHLLPGARIQSGAAYNFPQERLPSARLSYQTPLGATYRELRFALRQTPLGAYRR